MMAAPDFGKMLAAPSYYTLKHKHKIVVKEFLSDCCDRLMIFNP